MDHASQVKALTDEATQAVKNNDHAAAASLLEQALQLDPDNLFALDMLGFVRFFQGQVNDALELCDRALALAPDHAYAHKGKGICLAALGQLDRGVEHLQRAIVLRPNWGDPYWDLAVALYRAKRFDEAIVVLAQAAAMVPQRAKQFRQFQNQIRRDMSNRSD